VLWSLSAADVSQFLAEPATAEVLEAVAAGAGYELARRADHATADAIAELCHSLGLQFREELFGTLIDFASTAPRFVFHARPAGAERLGGTAEHLFGLVLLGARYRSLRGSGATWIKRVAGPAYVASVPGAVERIAWSDDPEWRAFQAGRG